MLPHFRSQLKLPSRTAIEFERRLRLLVTIHDMFALNAGNEPARSLLVESEGVPVRALTLLVIPRHEDRAPLDRHGPTRDWLRQLADSEACLAMHGLTHRMEGRVRNPWQWALAKGFARGQGEFLLSDRNDFARRLEASRAIFRRAGLEEALQGFVPPAWLLSKAALLEVRQSGFSFYERFSGIVSHDVGAGASADRLWFLDRLIKARTPLSLTLGSNRCRHPRTRALQSHPADMTRPSTVHAIRAILGNLRNHLQPLNYGEYLRGLA